MNNTRRKVLANLKERIEEIRDELEAVLYEEQDYLDNIPENLQGSERYEKSEEAVSAMEEVVSSLEEVADNIDSAIE